MAVLTIPIKFRIEIDKAEADGYDTPDHYMQKAEMLKPVKIMVSTEYAESLEYGTAPLENMVKSVHGGAYTRDMIFQELKDWASKKETRDGKFPIRSVAGQIAFARNLTDKFFREGMIPHPYFRPAMDWMVANMQSLSDEGNTMLDIAILTLQYMNRILIEGDHIFNGTLQKSMSAHIMSYDETIEAMADMNDTQWEELYGITGWETNEDRHKGTQQ